LTGQLTGISEDDLGSILIRPAFHYCELVMRHARLWACAKAVRPGESRFGKWAMRSSVSVCQSLYRM